MGDFRCFWQHLLSCMVDMLYAKQRSHCLRGVRLEPILRPRGKGRRLDSA